MSQQLTCASCGETGHKRSSFRGCKNYTPRKRKTVEAAPSGAASQASEPTPTQTAWTLLPSPNTYELEYSADVRSQIFLPGLKRQCKDIHDHVTTEGKTLFRNVENASRIKAMHVAYLVMGRVVSRMVPSINEGIRRLDPDVERVDEAEFLRFVGALIFFQMTTLSRSAGMMWLQVTLGQGHPLPLERFKQILKHVSAIDPSSFQTSGATFGPSTDLVESMRHFEQSLFVSTRKLTASHDSILVIDDELVGTRSKEVHEAGKDGVKNDAVADSLLRIMHAVRHNGREYNQAATVERLLIDVDVFNGQRGSLRSVGMTADRGYSKSKLWSAILARGAWFLMTSNTAGDPFVPLDAALKKVESAEKKLAKERAQRRDINESRASSQVNASSQENTSSQEKSASRENPARGKFGRQRETLENVKARAISAKVSDFDPNFVIDDAPLLGRELYAATSSVGEGTSRKSLMAIAFRDSQARATEKTTRVLRFVTSGFSHEKKLPRTICMEPLDFPNGTRLSKDVLFHPCNTNSKSVALRTMEQALKSRGVLPLTCWQRCADWSVLRTMVLTGTTSHLLARQSPEARRFLLKTAWDVHRINERTSDDDNSDSSVSPEGASRVHEDAGSEASNEDSDGDSGDAENEAEDHDGDGASTAELDDNDAESVTSDLEDNRGDLEEADDESFQEGIEAFDTAVENNPNEVFRAAAESLMASWFFSCVVVTKQMKTGTINKANLFKSIQNQVWCRHIFKVGLVSREREPFLAVSSDAVAQLTAPGKGPSTSQTLASVEIKTRSANESLERATKIQQQRGRYFSCKVGDDLWWSIIPDQHRGQVLHQAMVLDIDAVLYVEGSVTEVLFACLVRVPRSVRSAYKAALMRFGNLFSWAYVGLEDDTPPPSPPAAYFNEEHRAIISSHIRLWRALRRKVQKGPLRPIRVFKSLAQVVNNTMKGEMDGHSRFVADIDSRGSFRTNLQQKVALRGILQLVVNSFIIFRVVHACTKSNGTFDFQWDSLESFRRACNEALTVDAFVMDLAMQFTKHSTDFLGLQVSTPTSQTRVPSPVASDSAVSSTSEISLDMAHAIVARCPGKRAKKRRKWFDTDEHGRRVRLCSNLPHQSVSLGLYDNGSPKVSVCALCGPGSQATRECSICKVALHCQVNHKTSSQSTSCFERWHSLQSLDPHHHSQA